MKIKISTDQNGVVWEREADEDGKVVLTHGDANLLDFLIASQQDMVISVELPLKK